MELMDNIPQNNNQKVTKLKLWFILVLVLIFILIIAAAVIWIYSQTLNKTQFKFLIDGKNQTQYGSNMFHSEGNNIYVSIKEISTLLGYKYNNGAYGQFTEEITKGYVSNNQEIASFEANSNKIYKYSAFETTETQGQSFTISDNVKSIGNNLYMSLEGLSKAFNVLCTRNDENNSLAIYTLPNLVSAYSEQITNSAITADTSNFTDRILFNNQKAILYNYIIIKDTKETGSSSYGVAKIDDPTNPIIGTKYNSIEFVEGSNDFIVKTPDGKMGIIASDGVTKVRIEYDDIKSIDRNLGLYLVTSNNKQGVVNRNGKIIVYQEYSSIGLPSTIKDSNVTNKYILFENAIPVQRNNLWGLIDINGNTILPLEYNGLGCLANNQNDNRYANVMVIPDVQGIIVEKDEKKQNATVKKYGIVKYDGTPMINVALDSIYSITEQGKTTYYATVGNEVIDIVNFIYDLQSGKTNGTITTNTTNENNTINQENNTINNQTNSGNLSQNNTQNNEILQQGNEQNGQGSSQGSGQENPNQHDSENSDMQQ